MQNQSVTIAKALAIIFMVTRHAGSPDFINDYLQLIRMPLFFFMSGFCFKEKYLYDTKSFMMKRVKGIYWPYVKWALFFLFIHNLLVYLHIYPLTKGLELEQSNIYTIKDYIFNGWHIISRMDCHDQLLGAYWFLKTLFWGSIIFYIFLKVSKNNIVGTVLLLIITIIFSYYAIEIPFFCIKSKEFFAAFLISIGHIYRQMKFNFEQKWTFIISASIIVGIGSNYIKCAITNYVWIEIIPFAFFAIIGTLMIFGLSSKIINQPVLKDLQIHLNYIGKHTFNIMTWHFLSMKLVTLFICIIYSRSINELSLFPTNKDFAQQGWWIIYTIVGIEIPILGSKIYDRINAKYKIKYNDCNNNIKLQ